MPGVPRTALWLLRRSTGLRAYHLAAAAFGLTAVLGAFAALFWWVGERADAAAGILGVALVALAYLSLATLVVIAAAALAGRVLLGRLRGVFGSPRS